jgi:hypothetical protein
MWRPETIRAWDFELRNFPERIECRIAEQPRRERRNPRRIANLDAYLCSRHRVNGDMMKSPP